MQRGSGKAAAPSRAPKARSCYICGRQYMLHSFAIHEAQCREMFEKWESQKPVRERRKCPEDPMKGFSPNMSMKELDALNAASHQTWNEQALVRCQNCNRTFLPEKLPIHQRSCTPSNPARKVDEGVATGRTSTMVERSGTFPASTFGGYDDYDAPESSVNVNSGNLMQCRNCGRKFNANSYAKHSKVCAKVFSKSRKVFNSAKQRMQGTELEAFYKANGKRASVSSMTSTAGRNGGTGTAGAGRSSGGGAGAEGGIPKWKLDSMRFRSAMKAAREVSRAQQKSKETGIPLHLLLPAKGPGGGDRGGMGGGMGIADGGYGCDEPRDGLRCPTCGRTFNQKAGERHIPQCKNIINKPSRLLKGSGQPSYTSPESAAKTGGKGTFGSGVRSSGVGFGGGDERRGSSSSGGGGGGGFGGYDAGGLYAPPRPGAGYGASVEGRSGSGRAQAAPQPRASGGFAQTIGYAPSGGGSRPGSAGALRAPAQRTVAPSSGLGTSSGRFSQQGSGQGAIRSGGFNATARPSPRLSDPPSRVLSGGGGVGGMVIGGGGGGAGGAAYRIAQSNVTSSENPLASRNRLW